MHFTVLAVSERAEKWDTINNWEGKGFIAATVHERDDALDMQDMLSSGDEKKYETWDITHEIWEPCKNGVIMINDKHITRWVIVKQNWFPTLLLRVMRTYS